MPGRCCFVMPGLMGRPILVHVEEELIAGHFEKEKNSPVVNIGKGFHLSNEFGEQAGQTIGGRRHVLGSGNSYPDRLRRYFFFLPSRLRISVATCSGVRPLTATSRSAIFR